MVKIMVSKQEANKLRKIPLSDSDISRRINDMAKDIQEQVVEKLKNSQHFALQFNESTDVSDCAQFIQGQIHHRIGSLLPLEDAQHKFLQIYFIGNVEHQLDQRQTINTEMRRGILRDLQQLLHEHHTLVRLFKTALDPMPNDDYKVVIRADKRPAGTHERQFNAPTIDEVAVVIVGESRHRSYEALQYPLMFWQGILYEHQYDKSIDRTEGNASDFGRLTTLPATFVRSPRHMHEYTQDAMTYVRHYGRPDLFITFACNPKWIEIVQLLLPGQTSSDRHDITARVFRQKIRSLMHYIVGHRVFRDTRCWMYSIEWQIRGLPLAHIHIWLVEKIQPDQIDDIIFAEIPDSETDPDLQDVVITNMINEPCGAINPQSPCMVDGKCSKRYPQNLTGKDGYPLYRRRSFDDGGRTITVKVKGNDFVVDNSWVVPYSPLLSKTFRAHCNVEYCNSVKSIKYICKYVTKGSDRAAFGLQAPDPNEEITRYQNVHLENGQRVYFTPANAAQRAQNPPATTLTSFFSICQSDPLARALLYSEMPRYYTWNASSKKSQRRKQGNVVPGHPDVRSTEALGRIYRVHPKNDECFYLRLLLVNVRGPTSFESLRTVNGVVLPTFRVAFQELNLHSENPHLDMNEEMHNQVLIEDMCYLMCGSLLARLGMTSPDRGVNDAFERELQREREYICIPLLNPQQKELYDTVMKAIDDGNVGLIFLDSPGGTGKTFLISLILAAVRARSEIAVAVAFSGIAVTMLEGCRSAHSALKLPLNLQAVEEPTCNIAKHSAMAKVLITSKIIIWDECTMSHKRALQALNRTMKDLRNDARLSYF
ncbi:uncharacterized protein LOC126767347 [Bactrocera neohumeralis]|uniref:uncharacterized protein LOC126767347 n=1 Tax=Bactrocera neohumeralis TaxID=98809 RepID=UPI00216696B5|nr:uncharacterized protein LOC126767347 [Bactrocera neohumeralis]